MAEEELPRTRPGTSGPNLDLATTPRAPGRRGGGLSTGQMALMTFAALVMGVLALLRVDSSALGDLGLVTVVGPVGWMSTMRTHFSSSLSPMSMRSKLPL